MEKKAIDDSQSQSKQNESNSFLKDKSLLGKEENKENNISKDISEKNEEKSVSINSKIVKEDEISLPEKSDLLGKRENKTFDTKDKENDLEKKDIQENFEQKKEDKKIKSNHDENNYQDFSTKSGKNSLKEYIRSDYRRFKINNIMNFVENRDTEYKYKNKINNWYLFRKLFNRDDFENLNEDADYISHII